MTGDEADDGVVTEVFNGRSIDGDEHVMQRNLFLQLKQLVIISQTVPSYKHFGTRNIRRDKLAITASTREQPVHCVLLDHHQPSSLQTGGFLVPSSPMLFRLRSAVKKIKFSNQTNISGVIM